MPKIIEQYYDLLSEVYDQKTPEFSRIPCKKAIEILQRNNITNLWNVLELWCGTGQLLDEIKNTDIQTIEYTWVDISSKMIDVIQQKHPNVQTKKCDIEENFSQITWEFDSVFMIGVFEFLQNKNYVLEQIYSRLKSWWYFLFSFEELVPWHPVQREKHSPMWKIWTHPVHPLTDFDNFRYSIEDVKTLLWDKFEIIDQEKFIWYYKSNDRIAIYYTSFLVQKL